MVDAVTNAPIPGAFVHLTTAGMSTTTDASGAFAFKEVPSGQQEMVTRADAYRTDTRKILVPASGPLRIALCPQGSPICESPAQALAASTGRP